MKVDDNTVPHVDGNMDVRPPGVESPPLQGAPTPGEKDQGDQRGPAPTRRHTFPAANKPPTLRSSRNAPSTPQTPLAPPQPGPKDGLAEICFEMRQLWSALALRDQKIADLQTALSASRFQRAGSNSIRTHEIIVEIRKC